MSSASEEESLWHYNEQETATGVKRKRAAFDGGAAASEEHKRRTCTHWLHRLPKIWLERDALHHLAECENRVVDRLEHVRRPVDESIQCRPRTRACQQKLRKGGSATSRPLPGDIPRNASYHSPAPSELKRFARQGGPDLTDLRGHPAPEQDCIPAMSSHHSGRTGRHDDSGQASTPPSNSRTPVTRTSSSSGAYHKNFQSYMRESGIYSLDVPLTNGQPQPRPNNFKRLKDKLQERRDSLSPSRFSEEDFNQFWQMQSKAMQSERKVTRTILPFIQGRYIDEEGVEEDMLFNNMDNMLLNGKSYMPKPDLYYGAYPDQLDARVYDKFSSHVRPSTIDSRPVAPNYFVEAKSTHASMRIAPLQLGMAGAAGARAMHSLQTYGDDVNTYDGNAYTLSASYIGGLLSIYSHHPAQPDGPGTTTEYYMNRIGTYPLHDEREWTAAGIAAFRNAKDWTEEQRNAMIERANIAARAAAQDADEAADEDDTTYAQENEQEHGHTGSYVQEESVPSSHEQDNPWADDDELGSHRSQAVAQSFTTFDSYSRHSPDASSVGKNKGKGKGKGRRRENLSSSSTDELAKDVPRHRPKTHHTKSKQDAEHFA